MRDAARGLTASMNMVNEYRRLVERHGFTALAADVRNRAQWMLIGAGFSGQDARELLDTAENEALYKKAENNNP